MRTQEDKEKILDRYKPTKYLVDEISPNMIGYLLDHFRWTEKIVKYKQSGTAGPMVVNYSPDRDKKQNWFDPVQEKVWDILGSNCYVWGSNIFRVEKPHILHNDDYEEKIYPIYKTLVLPLEVSKPTNFVTFDQAYLDGPVKLFRGYDPVPESYYNKSLTDYSNIVNYTDKPFDKATHEKYLSHIPYQALHGLTVEKVVPWVPGNAIIFDMGRIHSASNFVAEGISHKIGSSIFTAKEFN